jgi:hypothetical protein
LFIDLAQKYYFSIFTNFHVMIGLNFVVKRYAPFLKLPIWARGESNGNNYLPLLHNFTFYGNNKWGVILTTTVSLQLKS